MKAADVRHYKREVLWEGEKRGRVKRRKVGSHVLELLPGPRGTERLVAMLHPPHERACPWESALALGEKFLDFEPSRVRLDKAAKPPPFLVAVGELESVVYRSRKFDGQLRRYRHTFKASARPLLAVHPEGRPLYVIGGVYRVDDRGIVK